MGHACLILLCTALLIDFGKLVAKCSQLPLYVGQYLASNARNLKDSFVAAFSELRQRVNGDIPAANTG